VTEKKSDSGGLSIQTLLISAGAAVVAAVVVPTFWARGSLIATAVTPVIVALASEVLRRPTQAISAAAPRVARRTGTGLAVRREQPTGVGARGRGPEQLPSDPAEDGISREDPFGLRAASAPRRRLPVRLGIATGLLAAVIGAGVVTAAELGIGHSFTSSKDETSLLGGRTTRSNATPTPTATPTAGATAQPTTTATPSATASTPTPTPTATTTPNPQSATPAPSPSPTP
jgi:cell division septation protein DedD